MMMILKKSKAEFEKTRHIAILRNKRPLKDIKHFVILPYPKTKLVGNDILGSVSAKEINYNILESENEELTSMGVYPIRYLDDADNHTRLINIIHEMNVEINGIQETSISRDLTFFGD